MYQKFINRTVQAFEAIMALGLAVMVVLVFANVVLRYGFNYGIVESEDISRFIFIWIALMGAVVGFRDNAHMGMDAITNIAPPEVKRVMAAVSHVLMLTAMGFLLSGSWDQMILNHDTVALGSVPYPLSWMYAAGVFASASLMLLIAGKLVRILCGRDAPDNFVAAEGALPSSTADGSDPVQWRVDPTSRAVAYKEELQ